jgi:hypothetical protein
MGESFSGRKSRLVAALVLVATACSQSYAAKPAPLAATVDDHDPVEAAKDRILSPEMREAAQLTSRAIAARLGGDEDQSKRLLEQAVEAAPDYALAHWERGEVLFEQKWRTPEAVAERTAKNSNYAEYLQRRAVINSGPVGHEEIARWCYREGLEYQERFHWATVLKANPNHKFARERMKVLPFGGTLQTPENIAALQLKMAAAQARFNEFRPHFVQFCEQVASGDELEAEQALAELNLVGELTAIPALESAVAEINANASSETAMLLSQCVIDALGRVDHPQSTMRLLDYAVFAEHPALRAAAAAELKDRPLTDYVPQLMGTLEAPIQAIINSFVRHGDDFTAMFDANYYQAGPLADVTSSSTHITKVVQAGGIFGPNGTDGPRTRATKVRVETTAAMRAAQARRQVKQANLQIAERNHRIREVLANVFEADLGDDPRAYWQSWTDYNELHIPEHPVYQVYDREQNSYCEIMSCFAPGTTVWTQAGPRPIEEIEAGEMVLSQNPSTGELAYRTVLQRTVRPPAPMASIETRGEPIFATLGHRFWVNGQGWVMAKFLELDADVHTLGGSANVVRVAAIPPIASPEAYNLVIDDFHTFFVGDTRVLVHDNSCPVPTASKTPGQAAAAETLAVVAAISE